MPVDVHCGGAEATAALASQAWSWLTHASPSASSFTSVALPTSFYKGAPDVRLVDHTGALSSAGLVQVQTDAGWASVCGMNQASADTVCKQMGYDHGSVATSPCDQYGSNNVCGAVGTPVAMSDLNCTGREVGLQECQWKSPDASCMDHKRDSVVICSDGDATIPNGSLRLLDSFGAPTIDGEGRLEVSHDGQWGPVCKEGFTPGTAAVACKQMGFTGVNTGKGFDCQDRHGENICGTQEPHMKLACNGTEKELGECPNETGEDVFCSPEQSVVIKCNGEGDTAGIPSKLHAPTVNMNVGKAIADPALAALLPAALRRPLPRRAKSKRIGDFL